MGRLVLVTSIVGAVALGFSVGAYSQSVPSDYGAVRSTLLAAVVQVLAEPTGNMPTATGTAFIVRKEFILPHPHDLFFLVTAKHLVSDWDIGHGHTTSLTLRKAIQCRFYSSSPTGNPIIRRIQITDDKGKALPRRLFLHLTPDIDVALVSLTEESLGVKPDFPVGFDTSFLLPYARVPMQLVGLGDQVFALGYPGGVTSSVTGKPIAKAGYLATVPGEPFAIELKSVDNSGKVSSKQVSGSIFLVDGLIVPGNSGGPVVLRSGLLVRRNPTTNKLEFGSQENQNLVIGLVSQLLDNTGLTLVYGSDYILEAIDQFSSLLEK